MKELDTLASELANRQDESDTSRKRLVEQSRDFKKNTPETCCRGSLEKFPVRDRQPLQEEQGAEASFLTIYKKLIDVPDPTSSLEYGMNQQKRAQKAQDLEIENQKLRETLDEYNKEFAEVKNQEVTIKNLREKLKELEDKLESAAQTKADEKERDLQREFVEKERVLQEKQLSAATKLGETEQKNQMLQKALESAQSELFDYKAKNEERSAAKSDEVELLVTDLERANQRNTAIEKELEGLRSQLQSASQSLQQAEQMQKAPNLEQAIDILSRSSLELELSAKEKEISQLVEEVQKLQTSNNKLRESVMEKTQRLEEQLQAKTTAFQKLEEKIQSQSDYEDLKRELGILKSLEFTNGADDGSEEGETEGPGKSLEMLLLEKNRTLQTENTTLKVTKSDLNGSDNGIRQAQAFASMIGQEVAAAYSQRQNASSSSDDQKSQIIQPIIVIPPGHSNISPSPLFTFGNGVGGHGYGAPFNSPFSGSNNSMYVNRQLLESYHWIDTSRVAKQIKDLLTQLNIGQRLFGELVLGMSQGSVSDILARPKPWDRLTAKGREPYIKMVQFLADPRNVEQLKILNAQRKGVDVDALAQSTVSPTQGNKSNSDAAINDILAKARQELDSQQNKLSPGCKSLEGNKRKRKKPQANRIIPSLWKTADHYAKSLSSSPTGLTKREPLAALTTEEYAENSELNTFDIIRRTKEVLEQHNIPQEPFGTYVVGMSQGSVSDLLSKTKAWENLTLKGKEPFVRMNIWLNDRWGSIN
ncbi:putative homeobox protein cut-like 1 isoform X5 [Apostichopus japonicus]|uniref:Putative homeobox protein cut-like 1 isoform X5 n=1 Tax=Stichopus japonicus TaxID=307972 RepID=A0A2G8L9J9_STIJA|nr:putative homeobox protein cut-like 1 isoform X5 [Apostichopus japonicus]